MRSRIAAYRDRIPANLPAEQHSVTDDLIRPPNGCVNVDTEGPPAGWSHDRRVTLRVTRPRHAPCGVTRVIWSHTEVEGLRSSGHIRLGYLSSSRTIKSDDRSIWPALSPQLTIRPGTGAAIADCGAGGRLAAATSTIVEDGNHFVNVSTWRRASGRRRRRRRLSPLMARLQSTS